MPLDGEILAPGDERGNVSVYGAHKPFGVDTVALEVTAGLTIREILDAACDKAGVSRKLIKRAHVTISLDGVEWQIDPRFFNRVRPKPGARLTFRAVPAGGGGGSKNPLRTVLMLAVVVAAAVAAPYLAPAVATALGVKTAVATSLIGAAITVVGSLVVNAIAPPRMPQLSSGGGNQSESPTYRLAGARNQQNPFGAIPSILGEHRVFPLYGARAYTEMVGQDQYLRMLFVFGYGPVAIRDLRIGETPLTEFSDWKCELRGVEWDGGSPPAGVTLRGDNDPLRLYPSQVIENEVGAVLSSGTWVTRTTEPNVDEITVEIDFPQGLVRFNSEGKRKDLDVEVQVQYRPTGSSTWISVNSFNLTERSARSLRFGRTWEVPRGQYDVRVRRVTEDRENDRMFDTTRWIVLRSITDDEPIQFDKKLAVATLKIKATEQLNNMIDSFNAICTTVCRDWNGSTWVERKTRNPASLYRHTLQGAANARARSDSQIDLATLTAWHEFCDSNGFTFDMVRDFTASVWETLADIASSARAAPSIVDGLWSVVIDHDGKIPVQHITPRNSTGFQAERVYRHLPHGWRVRFINRDTNYQHDERIVYDDGYDETNATLFEGLELPGITDPDLVWKHGRYHIASARLRPEQYSWQMDFEHIVFQRGDLVRVTHDVPLWGVGTARIKSVEMEEGEAVGITLDDVMTIVPGENYVVRVRKNDGSSWVRAVDNPGETTASLTFSEPVESATAPEVGDLVQFGIAGTESAELIVHSITPASDLRARVVAVDYAPDIFYSDTGAIPPYDPNITRPPGLEEQAPEVPRIVNILTGSASLPDDRSEPRIVVEVASFTGTVPVRYIESRHRLKGSQSQWTVTRADAENQAVVIRDVELGDDDDPAIYDIAVRSVSPWGVRSRWSDASDTEGAGDMLAPGPVTNLQTAGGWNQIALSWTNPEDSDLRWIEIWEADQDDRDTATRIARVSGTSYVRSGLQGRTVQRWYWARAVDQSGNIGPWNAEEGTHGVTELLNENDLEDSMQELLDDLDLHAVVPVYDLPGSGSPLRVDEKVILYVPEKKLYQWNESEGEWQPLVADVEDGAITAAKIAAGVIDQTHFAGSLSPIEVVDGLPDPQTWEGSETVVNSQDRKLYRLENDAWERVVGGIDLDEVLVDTDNLVDGAVEAVKIAQEAVEASKIKTGAVLEDKLADAAVTAGKIAANAISTENLQDELITAEKLVANAVTNAKIAAGAITEEKLVDAAVTAGKIADEAIGATKFARGISAPQTVAKLPVYGSSEKFLVLNNESGTRARTADQPALNITGDITLVARISHDLWYADDASWDAIISRRADGVGSYEFFFRRGSTQRPYFYFTDINGNRSSLRSAQQITAAANLKNGDPIWLAVTYVTDATKSTAAFYWSQDGVEWHSLGSDSTGNPRPLGPTTGEPLEIGRQGGFGWPGRVFNAQVYSGGGFTSAGPQGTLVADFNASHAEFWDTEFVSDTTGETWELLGEALIVDEHQGKLVVLETDGKLYRYDHGEWTNRVPAADLSGLIEGNQLVDEAITAAKLAAEAVEEANIKDGAVVSEKLGEAAVTAEKIAAGAIEASKFASGISAPQVVPSLPTEDNFEGRLVVLDSDGQLYRYHDGEWTAAVPASNVTGQLTNEQIEQIEAAKVSGQLTDEQIAAIDAAKVSGQLTNDQIADLAAAKITGQLTDSQIEAIAAAKLTGEITETQISDDAITAPKIAANAVIANHIAANAIGADQIAANAVGADHIAANSIAASKLAVLNVENLAVEPYFEEGGATYENHSTISFEAFSGSKSPGGYRARIAARVANTPLHGSWLRVEPGETYLFEAYVGRVDASTTGNARLTMRFQDAEGGSLGYDSVGGGTSSPNESGYQHLSTTITIKPDAYFVSPSVQIINSDGTGSGWYVYSFFLAKKAPSVLIEDGAITAGKVAANAITADKVSAGAITTDAIAANAITTPKLDAGAVITSKLAANAVVAEKIAANAITTPALEANAITAEKIASDAIETRHILANAITAGQIAAGAVGADQIQANAVGADQISANAITASKLAVIDSSNMFTDPNLEDFEYWDVAAGDYTHRANVIRDYGSTNVVELVGPGSGDGVRIRNLVPIPIHSGETYLFSARVGYEDGGSRTLTVGANFYAQWLDRDGASLRSESVSGGAVPITNHASLPETYQYQFVAPEDARAVRLHVRREVGSAGNDEDYHTLWVGGLVCRKVVNAVLIEDGAITAEKITANAVTADKIASGAVIADHIQANAIDAVHVNAGAIGTDQLAANAITAEKVTANAINGSHLAADSVDTEHLVANAITAGQIAAGAVGADQIDANAITSEKIAANAITTRELAIGDFSNLAPNPSFEQGEWSSWPSAWSVVQASSVGLPDAPAEFVAEVPVSAATADANVINPLTVRPGEKIYVSIDAIVTGDNPNVEFRAPRWYRTPPGYPSIGSSSGAARVVSSPGWHRLEWVITLPNEPTLYGIRLAIRVYSGGSGDFAYFTNAVVKRVSGTVLIENGAITAEKVAANAITAGKIAANAITAQKIAAGTITGDEIAADTIAGDKLLANAITTREIDAGAVTADQIEANAITATAIAANAVTGAKIQANAVTAQKIAANAVTASKVQANAIEANHISSDAIEARHLSADSVTAGAIQTGAVNTDQLAAGAITAEKLAAGAITAEVIAIGDFTNLVSSAPFMEGTWDGWDNVPNGWYFDDSSETKPTPYYIVIPPTSSYEIARVANGVPCRPGDQFLWHFEARTLSQGDPPTVRFRIYWDDAYGNIITNHSAPSVLSVSAPFAEYEGVFTAPAGAASFRLYIANYAYPDDRVVGLSNVQFRRMTSSVLIEDGAVTAEKVAANAITANKLAADSVTAGAVAAGAIDTTALAASAVVASKIASGAITAAKIQANAVNADKISANTIRANNIYGSAVNDSYSLYLGGSTLNEWSSTSSPHTTTNVLGSYTTTSEGQGRIYFWIARQYDPTGNIANARVNVLNGSYEARVWLYAKYGSTSITLLSAANTGSNGSNGYAYAYIYGSYGYLTPGTNTTVTFEREWYTNSQNSGNHRHRREQTRLMVLECKR